MSEINMDGLMGGKLFPAYYKSRDKSKDTRILAVLKTVKFSHHMILTVNY